MGSGVGSPLWPPGHPTHPYRRANPGMGVRCDGVWLFLFIVNWPLSQPQLPMNDRKNKREECAFDGGMVGWMIAVQDGVGCEPIG